MLNFDLLSILFLLGLFGLLAFWLRPKRPKLPPSVVQKYIQRIRDTQSLDPAHGIMESHKIFVKALQPLAPKPKTGAEKIKKIARYLPNEKRIWHFHRLRNKLAHEVGMKVSSSQANDARENFIRALKALS